MLRTLVLERACPLPRAAVSERKTQTQTVTSGDTHPRNRRSMLRLAIQPDCQFMLMVRATLSPPFTFTIGLSFVA
jgi:hypothetical protein